MTNNDVAERLRALEAGAGKRDLTLAELPLKFESAMLRTEARVLKAIEAKDEKVIKIREDLVTLRTKVLIYAGAGGSLIAIVVSAVARSIGG